MFKKSRVAAAASLMVGGACAVALPSAVFAQESQRIEIVGSNIKRIASEGALPVVILTREQIARSPASTVQELLQTLGVSGQRGFETQASASFVPGASSTGLRGLSASDTLILLNGRRVAPFASSQQSTSDGAVAFVDLNSFPPSALEQIQILKDGASAIYGADAIAGVINLITRKDYQGLEVGTRIGRYDEKGGNEIKGSVTAGIGDISKDRYNLLASLEVGQIDPIYFRDRNYFKTFDHRAKAPFLGDQRSSFSDYGNYAVVDGDGVFRRGTNCPVEFRRGAACRYDFGPVEQLQPDQKKVGGLLVGTFALTPNTTLFGEVLLNRNTTEVEGRAPAMDTSTDFFQVDVARRLPLGTTRDALRAALAQQVPAGLLTVPGGTLLDMRTRFTEFGPRSDTTTSDTSRIVAGVRGSLATWDWEAAFLYSGAKGETVNHNEIRKDLLVDQILAGSVNMFAGPAKTGYAPSRFVAVDNTKSTQKGFDAKASGEVAKLGGIALMMAAGLEARKEEISSSSDPFSAAGLKLGSAATGTNGSRDAKSVFVEFSVPVSKALEFQLAARHDRYSDFGSTTNPKVAMRLQPVPSLLMRASYGTAFKAPSLFQLYESQSAGGYEDLIDTKRCAVTGAPDDCDFKLTEVRSGGAKTLGLDLKPEKSKNLNLGLVFEPATGTSLSIDYWRIKKDNAITQPVAQQAIDSDGASVIRNPTVNGVPGTIIRVVATYFNAFKQDISGVDVDLSRAWKSDDGDRFNANVSLTYLHKFDETRDPAAGPQGLQGNYNGAGANPRWKGTANFRWERGNWAWTATGNYIHSYDFSAGVPAVAASVDQPTVPAFFTMDAQLSYTGIKNLNLRLGIRNLLGEDAPYLAFFPAGTDTAQYDARGRFYYLAATYTFR